MNLTGHHQPHSPLSHPTVNPKASLTTTCMKFGLKSRQWVIISSELHLKKTNTFSVSLKIDNFLCFYYIIRCQSFEGVPRHCNRCCNCSFHTGSEVIHWVRNSHAVQLNIFIVHSGARGIEFVFLTVEIIAVCVCCCSEIYEEKYVFAPFFSLLSIIYCTPVHLSYVHRNAKKVSPKPAEVIWGCSQIWVNFEGDYNQ